MTATVSTTPDARGVWRKARTWLALVAILLSSALITLLTIGSLRAASGIDLDPDSPAPNGAKALYQVLGQHGVTTSRASSLADVDEQLSASSTLVIDDYGGQLPEDVYFDLLSTNVSRIDRVVLLRPNGSATALADEISTYAGEFQAPDGQSTLPAKFEAGMSCPLAEQAPQITNEGGTEFEPLESGIACYQVRDGAAVVFGNYHGIEVVVVGVSINLTNDYITKDANAAMGVALLGSTERLVWYTPSNEDAFGTAPRFGDYVPPWLTPLILLLLVAGVATVLWRGRRFGPLVPEQLPVTVPAAETVEGRARLYDHADARLHALDSIRIGTLNRLANLLGLGRNASSEAIAEATATTAAVPREHAYRVLLTADPASDAQLVDYANAAAELEQRVRAATGRASTQPNHSTRTAVREHNDNE